MPIRSGMAEGKIASRSKPRLTLCAVPMDGAIPGTASAELLLFEVVAVDQLHVED